MRFKVFSFIVRIRFLLSIMAVGAIALPACQVSGSGQITPSPTTTATTGSRTTGADTGTGGTDTGTNTGKNSGTTTGTTGTAGTGTTTMGGGNPNNAPPAPPQDGDGIEKCDSPVCTPKRIMASRCKDKVRLAWSLVPNAAKYKVFRTEGSSVEDVGCTSDKHCQNIAITTEAYHEDDDINKDTNYVYVVRAMNAEGTLSELSPAVVSLQSSTDCVEHPGPNNIYQADDHGGLAGECTAFAFDPNHAYTLFLGHRDGGMLTSLDAGMHWMKSSSGLGNGNITDIVVDPHNNANVYVGTQKGLYVSFDHGVTWKSTGIKTAVAPGIQLVNINDKRCIYVPTDSTIKWRCDLKSEPVNDGTWSTVNTPDKKDILALNNVKCITKEKNAKCLCQCTDDKNTDLGHFVFHAVLSGNVAYEFEAKTDSSVFAATAIKNGDADAKVQAMHADKNDPNHFVYLEKNKAIYETRDAGKTFTSIISSSLNDDAITQVLVDSHDAEGKTIWYAGPKGIRRYNSGGTVDFSIQLPDKTTFNPPVSRIIPNVLWKVGFCGQKGLYYYDQNKLMIAHGTLKANYVRSFYAGSSSPKLLASVAGYNEGLAPSSDANSWAIWSKNIKDGDQLAALPCGADKKLCVVATTTTPIEDTNTSRQNAVRASKPGETTLKGYKLGAGSTVISDTNIDFFLPNTLEAVPGATGDANYVWALGKTKGGYLVAVRGVFKTDWSFNIFPMSKALQTAKNHNKEQYSYSADARVLPIPGNPHYVWVIDGTKTLYAALVGDLTKKEWVSGQTPSADQKASTLFLAPAATGAAGKNITVVNQNIVAAAVNPKTVTVTEKNSTTQNTTTTTIAGLLLDSNTNNPTLHTVQNVWTAVTTTTKTSDEKTTSTTKSTTILTNISLSSSLFADKENKLGFGSFNGFTTLNKARIAYSPDGKKVVLVIHATNIKSIIDKTGVFIADTTLVEAGAPQNINAKTTKWTDITRDAALVVPTEILWSGTDFYMATEGSSILKWPKLGE